MIVYYHYVKYSIILYCRWESKSKDDFMKSGLHLLMMCILLQEPSNIRLHLAEFLKILRVKQYFP